jgi:hypothetical protein
MQTNRGLQTIAWLSRALCWLRRQMRLDGAFAEPLVAPDNTIALAWCSRVAADFHVFPD